MFSLVILCFDYFLESIMDIDNIPFKPSNLSLNDTLKSLLSRKHETAKKTFGMFTEIKPARKIDFEYASERIDRNCNFNLFY